MYYFYWKKKINRDYMQKKILIYDDNPFHAKMSSQFQITADPRHRVAQITQLLIITSCIVRGPHDSIWTRIGHLPNKENLE